MVIQQKELETFPVTLPTVVRQMTIKDIAALCGVSVSTVSRVLNNHPDVSAQVRSRVMEVVQANHYIPSNSARDLVRTRSDAIGLVVRGTANPFFAEVLKTMEAKVTEAGYTMVLHQIGTCGDELQAGAMLERDKKLRGLLLLGGRSDYTKDDVAALNVPFVCCTYDNSYGTLGEEEYSSVSIDDEQEACRAVKSLIGKGHRRIAALISARNDRSISELRYGGYRRALKEAGIALDETLVEETGSFQMPEAYEAMERLLRRTGEFTALFAISDAMAVAAIKALDDAGRRVPEDCSVMAIDGITMSAYTLPTLSTLIQPADQIAAEAVRILVDRIEGRAAGRHVQVDTILRPGRSVCVKQE